MAAKTAHTSVDWGSIDHSSSMNTKAFHTHIPRQYNADTTFNSTMIIGGGTQECGTCGEIMNDSQS